MKNLKRILTGQDYVPGRAGHVNEETQFVLKYFGVQAPELIEHVKTEVRDIDIRQTKGVKRNISLKKAWNTMQDANVVKYINEAIDFYAKSGAGRQCRYTSGGDRGRNTGGADHRW